ncbi:MAG: UDP-glucose/GDP-mannose dehydrogenase family protein [Candidatus Jordarchaeaceae archaeon]
MTPEIISIVGTGYVGLCTGVGFASKGFKVIMSTHDQKKAEDINRGIPPFYEPDLDGLLKKVTSEGHLRCVTNRKEAILHSEVTFVASGTPSQPDGSINLEYVKEASREIGKALAIKSEYHVVVVKSTVVPGTTEKTVRPLIEENSRKRCGLDFGLCMSPEFLREGSAMYDTFHPDRIVIGEYDKKSGDMLQSLFERFHGEDVPPILRTSLPTAEMIKYANNAFLATKISFINQIANICQKIPGTDVCMIAQGIGLDHRINPSFLRAGLGYGGSCFPKDVKAIIAYSKSLGYTPNLLEAVEEINRNQPYKALELAKELTGDLKKKRIAILGLSFKPETDDMREAVSIRIVKRLLEEGADVVAYDPVAVPNAKVILGDHIAYAQSASECLKNADCCIIVTEWKEFKELKPEDFIYHMRNPVVIDGRRIYDPKLFSEKLKYAAIGLGKTK